MDKNGVAELKDFVPGRFIRSKNTGHYGVIVYITPDRYPNWSGIFEPDQISSGFICWETVPNGMERVIEYLDVYCDYIDFERICIMFMNFDERREPFRTQDIEEFQEILRKYGLKP